MQAEYYPITGIEGAYIALGVQDSADAYSAETPFFAPPAENANWTISQGSTAFYGNNVKQDELFGTEINTVVLRLNGISEELDARIRGKGYIAATGRVAGSGNTTPPLCALGLKINKAPEEYVYVWFLKGRFSGGNIVAQTTADNRTINMREYTFTAMETEKQFTFLNDVTGQSETKGLTWFKGESANPAFSATSFFSQVQTPDTTAAPDTIALSTIVPADAATSIAVTASVVLTFNNKIASENVALIKATDGAAVAITKSFDATGKILTLAHGTNLAASTKHYVIVSGVVDVYGQELAYVTKSFTTA